jgi:activator of Hsp90 ATPase-like protein
MMAGSPISTAERPSDREVVFHRLLDAPRELVWKVWSDPEHLHHWFGPAGFTLTTLEFAFVPDGVWRASSCTGPTAPIIPIWSGSARSSPRPGWSTRMGGICRGRRSTSSLKLDVVSSSPLTARTERRSRYFRIVGARASIITVHGIVVAAAHNTRAIARFTSIFGSTLANHCIRGFTDAKFRSVPFSKTAGGG